MRLESAAARTALAALWLVALACASPQAPPSRPPAAEPRARPSPHSLEVTATAYNAIPAQTSGDPHVGAFGDAVVRGLARELQLPRQEPPSAPEGGVMEERCQHEACGCEIPKGQRFCSEACRDATGDEERCGCGHPDCA